MFYVERCYLSLSETAMKTEWVWQPSEIYHTFWEKFEEVAGFAKYDAYCYKNDICKFILGSYGFLMIYLT